MKKHFHAILFCLALLAFLIRAAVCLQLADSPEVASPNSQTDMATYLRLAQEIQHGQWPDHFDYQPFYYTTILPLLLPASGSKLPLMAFQALAGAASVLLAGLCAAQIFGRKYAWTAALLLALARFHIFYTPFALYEVLQGFWMILLLHLTLLAWRHNRWRLWAAAAAVLAAAILTRGNAVLLLPVLIAAAILRNWPCRRLRGVALALAIILIAYLPQLPFAIRNFRATGRWTGPSTAAAKVLVLGNSPEAPAAGLAYPLTYSSWVAQDENGSCPATTHILRWLLKEPLAFMELKFRTALHFWDSDEVPNNVNIDAHGYPYSSLLRMPFLLGFGLLAPLAFAGFFLALRRKSPARRILVAFNLILFGATVMFYMLARFRIASVPILCVLASGAVATLAKTVSDWKSLAASERQRRALTIAGALAAGFFMAHGALFIYQMGYESDIMAAIKPDGICVTTPDGIVLVHDHAALPLGVGGAHPFIPPQGSHKGNCVIRKTFVIPEDLARRLKGKPFTVRLMVASGRTQASTPGMQTRHHDQTRTAKPVKRYAFCTFLEADFESLMIDQDNTAAVTFEMPADAATTAIFDLSRNFGRTSISIGGSPYELTDEAFAELQATLTSP